MGVKSACLRVRHGFPRAATVMKDRVSEFLERTESKHGSVRAEDFLLDTSEGKLLCEQRKASQD